MRHSPYLLDVVGISTDVRMHASFNEAPEAYAAAIGISVLDIRNGTKKRREDELPYFTIDLLSYGAVHFYAERVGHGGYRVKTLTLNPSRILYGYNGRPLSTLDLQLAFSIAMEAMAPLLADAGDAIHLIPGLAPKGHAKAYWNLLELPFNLSDPDRELLNVLRNCRHPRIRSKPMPVEGESYRLGKRASKLSVKFYYKDIEMRKLVEKFNAMEPQPLMRIEVTLKGPALCGFMAGEGNIEVINGTRRLVRFAAADTVRAHRAIVSELAGCYQPAPAVIDQSKDKVGRFIARASSFTGTPVDELIALYLEEGGESKNTRTRIRKAALARLAQISPFSMEQMIGEDLYNSQPEVVIPLLDASTAALRETDIHPLVRTAYGPRP